MTNEDEYVRVLSIDPSTSHMGVSILDINVTSREKVKLIYSNTIHGDNVKYYPAHQYDDDGVLSRVYGLCRSLSDLIEMYEPHEVICEDNYQGKNVSTFKILVMVMIKLEETVTKHNLYMDKVMPNPAKDIVNANFKGTTKEDVAKGVKACPVIEVLNNINLDSLSEHAIDSVAIGLYRAIAICRYHDTLYCEPKEVNTDGCKKGK